MKVAYYEVGKDMVVKEIDGSLDAMQKLVEGNIEVMGHDKISDLLYIVNEEGYVIPGRFKPNRKVYDGGYTIMGNFFVAKAREGEIIGLDDEDIHKLMAVDMTVEQMIEMDRLYRELCEENNHLKKVMKEAKEMLQENYEEIQKLGVNNSYPMGRAIGTIKATIEILDGRMEKEDVR